MDKTLQDYLTNHKIPYKLHEHPAVFTVEQASKQHEIRSIPGVRTKNLFLKDDHGEFYLICIPGEKRLNVRALEKHFKVKKLQFGSADELKQELHLTPGSVSVFGMIYAKHTKLVFDKQVWQAEVVGCHPNINTATLELTHAALEKFCSTLNQKPEVIDLA